jgi:hypothetical protein
MRHSLSALVLTLAFAVCAGAADPAPGIAVIEAFTDDTAADGRRGEGVAKAILSTHQPGLFVLVYHIANGDPGHDRFAALRGTVVKRAHEADAGEASALVVNGTAIKAGASEAEVGSALSAAVLVPPRVVPDVRCEWWGGVMWIGIAVPGAPDGATVTLAVAEDGVEAIPGAAEGVHDATVRTYKTVAASPKLTDVDLSLPPGIVRERTSVVAVVYDAAGTVIGAGRCASTRK